MCSLAFESWAGVMEGTLVARKKALVSLSRPAPSFYKFKRRTPPRREQWQKALKRYTNLLALPAAPIPNKTTRRRLRNR